DHFVKEELRASGYVRYMDDIILWDDDRARLKSFGRRIEEYMSDKLKLTLKPRELNSTSSGLSFLGMRVFPHSVRLGARARLRFVKKYRRLQELFENEGICEFKYEARMRALIAHIESAESKSFRRRVFQL
ncbi:MAG: hypothetical protein IKX88_15235, partial [Thermoguttaceae bacterium]|nr:hypothetical protein [Thermoguttaceae bacterium]